MREDRFPLDIFAIKKYGTEEWQRNFFWPVSDEEFAKLCRDIEEGYANQMNRRTDEVKRLAGIQYKLCIEYANLLHALKVIQRLKSEGKEAFYTDRTWWYKDILKGGRIQFHMPTLNMEDYIQSGRPRTIARTLLRSIKYNGNVLKFIKSLGEKETLKIFGPINPLMLQYTKNNGNWCRLTCVWDWLPTDYFLNSRINYEGEIDDFSKGVIDELKRIAKEHGIELPERCIEHLKMLTYDEIIHAGRVLDAMGKRLKKEKKRIHLLIVGAAKPFSKALSIAVQQKGGRVTSFAHGGDVGLINWPLSIMFFYDMALAHEFVAYTSESARLYERIKETHSRFRGGTLNIISAESDEYLNLWRTNKEKPLPDKVKRVMLIGYPHNQWRRMYCSGGSFSPMRLDLELRLIDFLKKAGYEVLYKSHPHRIKEAEGIFEGKCRVLTGYFQDRVSEADAFLFPTATTTAFPIALCTKKPVVLLDLSFKLYQPFSEPMELLKKRCSFVNTHFDDKNRIIFDGEAMLNALDKNPKEPDNQFIQRYMFPSKEGR